LITIIVCKNLRNNHCCLIFRTVCLAFNRDGLGRVLMTNIAKNRTEGSTFDVTPTHSLKTRSRKPISRNGNRATTTTLANRRHRTFGVSLRCARSDQKHKQTQKPPNLNPPPIAANCQIQI